MFRRIKHNLNNPKKPWPVFIAQMVIVAALIQIAFLVFAARFQIGWDTQEIKCLPYSVYLLDKRQKNIATGDYVLLKADHRLEPFFPEGSHVAKIVKGQPGDKVDVKNGEVFINEELVGELENQNMEKLGKSVAAFDRTLIIAPDEYWVMGTTPRSFDSRYWGTIRARQVVGKAYPLF